MTQDQIVKLIKKAMAAKKWKYDYDDDGDFTLRSKTDTFVSSIKTILRVTDKGLMLFVTSDTMVKKNIRAVAEYFARINHSLTFGAFELDCDSGDYRFFLFVSIHDIEAKVDEYIDYFSYLIAYSAFLFENIASGLFVVMFNVISPKMAAEKIESKLHKFPYDNDDDNDDDDSDDDDDDIFNDDNDEEDNDDIFNDDDDDDNEEEDDDDDNANSFDELNEDDDDEDSADDGASPSSRKNLLNTFACHIGKTYGSFEEGTTILSPSIEADENVMQDRPRFERDLSNISFSRP